MINISPTALSCHTDTLGSLELLSRATLTISNKRHLYDRREKFAVSPMFSWNNTGVPSTVPSLQRRSGVNAGSQVRLLTQVKDLWGWGNRPLWLQFKPTKSPTLYSSLLGYRVMPSGTVGGRHTFPKDSQGQISRTSLFHQSVVRLISICVTEHTHWGIFLVADSMSHQAGSWWTGSPPSPNQCSTGTPHPHQRHNTALLSVTSEDVGVGLKYPPDSRHNHSY